MDTKKIIGQRIKQRRKELNLTQEDIGNKLGLHKSTIQRYENGTVDKIKLPILEAISKILKINSEWLLLKTDISNLSNDETLLLFFASLNPEGQKQLFDYLQYLTSTPKYKK